MNIERISHNSTFLLEKPSYLPCYKRLLHYIRNLLATLFCCTPKPLRNRVEILLPLPPQPTLSNVRPDTSTPQLQSDPVICKKNILIQENNSNLASLSIDGCRTPLESIQALDLKNLRASDNESSGEDNRRSFYEKPSLAEPVNSSLNPSPPSNSPVIHSSDLKTLFCQLSRFGLIPDENWISFESICKKLNLKNPTLELYNDGSFVYAFDTCHQKEKIHFYPSTEKLFFQGISLFRDLIAERLSFSMDKTLSRCIAYQLIPQNCTQVVMVKENEKYKLTFSLENPTHKKFNGKVNISSYLSTSFEFTASYEKTICASLYLSESSVTFSLDQGFCLIRTQEPLTYWDVVPKGILVFLSQLNNPQIKPFLDPITTWKNQGYQGDLSLRFPSMAFQADQRWNNMINFSCCCEVIQNQHTTQIPQQSNLWAPATKISTFFEAV